MSSLFTQAFLSFRCEGLKDTDGFTKSDPYVVLCSAASASAASASTVVGRTEVVKNSVSPVFQTTIAVNFFFEMRQSYVARVWDKDAGGDGDDALGYAEFTLGAVMTARGRLLTLPLCNGDGGKGTGKGTGSITISATVAGASRGTLSLRLRGENLKKMDLLSKSDPFFRVSHVLPGGQRQLAYESAVIDGTLNPQWPPTPPLDLVALCAGDTEAPCVAVDCFDKDPTSVEPMGGFVVSASELMAKGRHELLLQDGKKQKSFGTIVVEAADFVKGYTLAEFLQGGLTVNMAFSIDFTGSNGPQSDPRSLHFYDPVRPNHYIRAMLAVSDVVQEYDSDRQFPAYGFGAVAPFTQGTSHFFPLNGNPANAYLNGMQQVVDTYAALLPQLRFSGPTNFAPCINAVTHGARQSRGVYTILMIMTDGAITDTDDTINALVAADDAPLSVIIIGIGSADFSSMQCLDGDGRKKLTDARGRTTRRDLVQFVPFNAYESQGPAALAAAVLQEIPRQVEAWARIAGVTPDRL